MQRSLAVSYRRFGRAYRPNIQGSSTRIAWPLTMEPTSCPEKFETTNLSCETSEKIDDVIYTATEAWNHAQYQTCLYTTKSPQHVITATAETSCTGSILKTTVLSRTLLMYSVQHFHKRLQNRNISTKWILTGDETQSAVLAAFCRRNSRTNRRASRGLQTGDASFNRLHYQPLIVGATPTVGVTGTH